MFHHLLKALLPSKYLIGTLLIRGVIHIIKQHSSATTATSHPNNDSSDQTGETTSPKPANANAPTKSKGFRSVPAMSPKQKSLYRSIGNNPAFTIDGAKKAFLKK